MRVVDNSIEAIGVRELPRVASNVDLEQIPENLPVEMTPQSNVTS